MNRLMMAAALCGALFGCANVCDMGEATSKTLATKAAGCSPAPTISLKVDKMACNNSLMKCSTDDQKNLNEYFQCLDKVSTCSGDGVSWVIGSLAPCEAKIEGVSAECLAAFN